jgi:CRISPR-associated protein Csm3
MENRNRKFYGKIIFNGKIKVKTGLHIGSQRDVSEIGGIDNPVVKDPITQLPYIPGSSLKGKLRSLLEIAENTKQPEEKQGIGNDKFFNRKITRGSKEPIYIHVCETYEDAKKCPVCRLFGSGGTSNFPARVVVRDACLTDAWEKKWKEGEELTEIKHENTLDRITSAASPRRIERVPPGVEFNFEIIYTIEDENDWKEDFKNLLSSMKMLEDSYLGGCGSRGYGKVEFTFEECKFRSLAYYFGKEEEKPIDIKDKNVEKVINKFDSLFNFNIPKSGGDNGDQNNKT